MKIIDVTVTIIFVVLLGASIFMLLEFYVCDNQNCKAFEEAKTRAKPGTKEYTVALLEELCADGMWPLPYIGATIITPLSIWFIGCEITVRNFAILFFVSFATTYFIISFFIHHYIQFIVDYAIISIEGDYQIPTN